MCDLYCIGEVVVTRGEEPNLDVMRAYSKILDKEKGDGNVSRRLTFVGQNGEICIAITDETRQLGTREAAYRKLMAYEDAEEQGRLIILP